MRLQDKIVLITGASRGVGAACALACAKEGAHLALVAKTLDSPPPQPGERARAGATRSTIAFISALLKFSNAAMVQRGDARSRGVVCGVCDWGGLECALMGGGRVPRR